MFFPETYLEKVKKASGWAHVELLKTKVPPKNGYLLDFKKALQSNKLLSKGKTVKNHRVAQAAKLCFEAFDGSQKSENEINHISIRSLEGVYNRLENEIRKTKSKKSPKAKEAVTLQLILNSKISPQQKRNSKKRRNSADSTKQKSKVRLMLLMYL